MSKKAAKADKPAEQPITPGIEPTEGAPPPVEAALPETPEVIEQRENALRKKVDEKSFHRQDKRAAMWDKRRDIIAAEREEFSQSDPAQARVSEQLAGADDAEDVDAAALAAEAAAAEAAAAGVQPGDEPPAEGAPPLASTAKTTKIVVDGVEREVSDDDVRSAGVAALQKLSAADARLQAAATYEAQLKDWAQNEEARLRAIAAAARQSPPPPATGAQAPVDVKATVAKSMSLLVEGQQEEAAELLTTVLDRLKVQAAPQTAGPGAEPNGADSQLTVQPPPVRRSKVEIEEANRVFNDEYGDLNDAAFTFTKELALANLRDPSNAGRNVTDIVRAAGNKARSVFKSATPPARSDDQPPALTPGEQQAEARRQLKARIPLAPTGASARAPAPPSTAPRIPTNKDYVAMLQRRAGNNSIPR